MDDEHDDTYGLILAFDSDDPEFTRGFELGQLWERLERDNYLHQPLVHAANAEMFIRMAEAKGLPFSAEPVDDEWMSITIGTPIATT